MSERSAEYERLLRLAAQQKEEEGRRLAGAPYCERHDSWNCADCRDEAQKHARELEMERAEAMSTALEAAALAFVAADRNYRDTYKTSGQEFKKPLNRETEAACKEANRTLHALERAAWNLALARGAIRTEQMRSAFYDEVLL